MTRKPSSKPILFEPHRQSRQLRDFDRDDYGEHEKFTEPTVCPECRAVFHKGRWQWLVPPALAQQTICPACVRVREKRPAGELTLQGTYLQRHRNDVLHLVRNIEAREKAEHPLSRIIDVGHVEGDSTIVTTTTIALARALGTAVEHAHRGLLSYRYQDGDALMRVKWQRFS